MSAFELAYLPAHEALARFKDRSLSPVDLTGAVLAQLEATEPLINALPLRYPEAARAAARDAEDRYMGKGAAPRPLEGLCVAVKDLSDMAGQPNIGGSLITSEAPVATSSISNARMVAAGGIPHARSATPEFSCSSTTWSRKWGVTHNPWQRDRTPGGSSGGAGAALAAGSATLAMGSDIAGSIRIPAACCGVVGYKPPRGRVPQNPPFNFDPYCHVGPMARSVTDVALLQNALAGPDPRDPFSYGHKGGALLPDGRGVPPDLTGRSIAWSEDLGGFAVDPVVRADFRNALRVFEGLGAELTEVTLDWGPESVDAALRHLKALFGTWIAEDAAGSEDLLTTYARQFAEDARTLPQGAALKTLVQEGQMGAAFASIMAKHDLFLCPTLACPPVAATHDPSLDQVFIEDRPVDPLIGWVLTVPFNMLSMYPVLALPTGFDPDGLPLGLQMVGHGPQEPALFEAALLYEKARGPWFTPGAPRPDLQT